MRKKTEEFTDITITTGHKNTKLNIKNRKWFDCSIFSNDPVVKSHYNTLLRKYNKLRKKKNTIKRKNFKNSILNQIDALQNKLQR